MVRKALLKAFKCDLAPSFLTHEENKKLEISLQLKYNFIYFTPDTTFCIIWHVSEHKIAHDVQCCYLQTLQVHEEKSGHAE